MATQLRLLTGDEEHRDTDISTYSRLPEGVRRDVRERFADLLVAVARSTSKKEGSNDLDEDHAEASGS
jgi:hypothetical protein